MGRMGGDAVKGPGVWCDDADGEWLRSQDLKPRCGFLATRTSFFWKTNKSRWYPQQPLEAAPNFHLNFLLPVKSGDLHHSNREVSKPDTKTCACFLKKMQNGHAIRVYLRINTEPEEYHAKYFSGPWLLVGYISLSFKLVTPTLNCWRNFWFLRVTLEC